MKAALAHEAVPRLPALKAFVFGLTEWLWLPLAHGEFPKLRREKVVVA